MVFLRGRPTEMPSLFRETGLSLANNMHVGPAAVRYQHEVDAYVPQISMDDQPLPLLACDLDLLEPETIPWKVDLLERVHFALYSPRSNHMPTMSLVYDCVMTTCMRLVIEWFSKD